MSTKEDNNGSGGSGLSVKVETTQQRIINAIFTVFAKVSTSYQNFVQGGEVYYTKNNRKNCVVII